MTDDILPSELISLFKKIEEQNIELILVGGYIRDFLLLKEKNRDLDFEYRIKDKTIEEGQRVLENFFLENKLEFESLPYAIYRVKYLNFDLEFSAPRKEFFENKKGHHNFTANLDFSFTVEESFKRRDFTINAIGFSLSQRKILDPFNGQFDLKEKRLKSISDDFYKDDVRFLRLIRFKNKFDFCIDQKLNDALSVMDLSCLSLFHFERELLKSKTTSFLVEFVELVKKNDIKINDKLECLLNLCIEKNIAINSLEELFIILWTKNRENLILNDFINIPYNQVLMIDKYLTALNLFKQKFGNLKKEIHSLVEDDFIYFESEYVKDLLILTDKKYHFMKLDDFSNVDREFVAFVGQLKLIKLSTEELSKIEINKRQAYIIFRTLKSIDVNLWPKL